MQLIYRQRGRQALDCPVESDAQKKPHLSAGPCASYGNLIKITTTAAITRIAIASNLGRVIFFDLFLERLIRPTRCQWCR